MDELIIRSGTCHEYAWAPWIALIPHLIWAAVVILLACWIGRDTIRSLLRRVSKVNIGGVELQLLGELEAAARARHLQPGSDELGAAARRLADSAKLISGARLLWVDDNPASIVRESRLFEQAGAHITRALSTTEAFHAIDRKNFDLILSDIARGADGHAGIDFADQLATRQNAPPVVFYVGKVEGPCPSGAFGVADRPTELVHLVLDSLARTRS